MVTEDVRMVCLTLGLRHTRDARDPVRALLGVQALDIMGSRTPEGGGVSIAGFRPEGGFRLQGFRIFGPEAPVTAPKAPF